MLLLRRVRRTRWDRPDWLTDGGAPVSCLYDLMPDSRGDVTRISLFRIGKAGEWADRVVSALACTSDSISAVDVMIFPEEVLGAVGLTVTASPAETPDAKVNAEYHLDTGDLEVLPVATLATLLHTDHVLADKIDDPTLCSLVRYRPTKLKSLINAGLSAGHLNRDRVTPGVLRKLGTR